MPILNWMMNIDIVPQKLDYKTSDWREGKKQSAIGPASTQEDSPEWTCWLAFGFFPFLSDLLYMYERMTWTSNPARLPSIQSTLSIHTFQDIFHEVIQHSLYKHPHIAILLAFKPGSMYSLISSDGRGIHTLTPFSHCLPGSSNYNY